MYEFRIEVGKLRIGKISGFYVKTVCECAKIREFMIVLSFYQLYDNWNMWVKCMSLGYRLKVEN